MEFDLFELFEYLLWRAFRPMESVGVVAAYVKIAGGHERVRKPDNHFSHYSVLIAGLICILGLGILASPSKSETQSGATPHAALLAALVHGIRALPAAPPRPAAAQDAGQAAPAPSPAAAPTAPKPVVLPEGDGKPIATEYCQMCHRLTNLTRAHK